MLRERRETFADEAGEWTLISRGGVENTALLELWRETQYFSHVGTGISWTFQSYMKGVNPLSRFQRECGISLETLLWKMASFRVEGRISWFFSSCGGKLEVRPKL